MRLLLDTHVFLWWARNSRRLKASTRARIQEAEEVFVSAASAWEVSIKAALGKLTIRVPLLDAVVASGFSPLPIGFTHAAAAGNLLRLHSDPFDRMLVAQAQVEGLHLVSAGHGLGKYAGQFIPA